MICFLVKKAIAETKNIDEQDPSGKTPLMVAISYHKTDTAILLIEKGAKVDVLDSSRRNALHYAAKEFSDKLFALIIEKGASANQIDQWGIWSDSLCGTKWLFELCTKAHDYKKY